MRLDAKNAGNPLGRRRLSVEADGRLSLGVGQLGLWSVSGLLGGRRPSAVGWAVWPIVVDSVERFSGRFWCHVGDEAAHVVPPLADRDAARAIAGVFGVIRLVAPRHHRVPRRVERAIPKAVFGLRKLVTARGGRHPINQEGRVAMLEPAEVVLSAPTPRQVSPATTINRACAHAASIRRERTFEKARKVSK